MAIARLGTYVLVQSSADTDSQNITVPSGSAIMLMFAGGWKGTNDWMSGGSHTIGGNALTVIQDTSNVTSNAQISVWRRISPPTGSQSFAWNWNLGEAVAEGVNFVFIFYSGVDTGSPIRDSGENTTGDDVTGMTAQAGDMMVGGATDGTTAYTSVNDDGQTEIFKSSTAFNTNQIAVGQELSEGDFYSTHAGSYPASVAVVLQAAAAGGSVVPLMMSLQRQHRS